jgi:hypothetical protein
MDDSLLRGSRRVGNFWKPKRLHALLRDAENAATCAKWLIFRSKCARLVALKSETPL